MKLCLKHLLMIGCMLLPFKSAAETDQDAANQVVNDPVFGQPLMWVGTQPPPAVESKFLSDNINIFKAEGMASGIAALEKFVNERPDSAWTPALNVNMAEYYRAHGRYSFALAHWEAAWNVVKTGNDPVSQYLAARTIAGWTRLLATLGEKEKLNLLFKEFDQLQLPLGTYGIIIQETKEALGVMNARPGVSYRCGSFALGHLANAMHLDPQVCRRLDDIDSPDGGFHMDELLKLAKTNGMEVEAVRRPAGAPLVVPSIVHWKLNHYAAIIQAKNGRYFVEDPTFGAGLWMDGDAINEEASGEFILPQDKVPSNWEKLSTAECAAIYGKGLGNTINDWNDPGPPSCPYGGDGNQDSENSDCSLPSANDGASSTNNPPAPPTCDCFDDPQPIGTYGMPRWSVSEPYEALWIEDVPLLYRQSNGRWMQLRIRYKSTGLPQPTLATGFGPDWSCNWIGYVQPTSSGLVSNYLSGGGVEGFKPDGTTPDYKTARVLTSTGIGFTVSTSTGEQNAYSYATTPPGSSATNYYLTQRLDKYGRTLQQMDYSTNSGTEGSLNNVVDEDGRTNIVELGGLGTLGAWCVITVTNPYNFVAQFNYGSRGTFPTTLFLTNIIDVQGFSTFFNMTAVIASPIW